jgi:hypothetical protein
MKIVTGIWSSEWRWGNGRCRSSDSRSLGCEDDVLIVVDVEVAQRCRFVRDLLIDFQCKLYIYVAAMLAIRAVAVCNLFDCGVLGMRVSRKQQAFMRRADESGAVTGVVSESNMRSTHIAGFDPKEALVEMLAAVAPVKVVALDGNYHPMALCEVLFQV